MVNGRLIVCAKILINCYWRGSVPPYFGYAGENFWSGDVKIKCVFCGFSHCADECPKYKSLSERKGRSKGRCFICLNPNHLYRECRSNKPCFYNKRKGNHHTSLCPEKFSYQPPAVAR